MASTQTFRLSQDSAEADEEVFVPASFEPWARMLVDAAGVVAGDRVLDVACGTGIVARVAADRVGPTGSVVGVDRNPAMLAIAVRLRPDIEWRQGDATGLPVLARSFDVVFCQAALTSFADPVKALREMARAIKDDGTVAIQVWDRLEGDVSELQGLLRSAGLWPNVVTTQSMTLRVGSADIPVRGHMITATLRSRRLRVTNPGPPRSILGERGAAVLAARSR